MNQPFDPEKFLSDETTEPNVRRPPIPENNPASADGGYLAIIGKCKTSSGTIGKGERIGQPWVSVMVPLQIDLPAEVQAQLNQPKLTITDRVFLDLTASNAIDNSPGRNRKQKDYREALGLNVAGEKFSWNMAQGKMVKVFFKHTLDMDGNRTEEVRAITKA